MNYHGPGLYRDYEGGVHQVLGLALREDSIDKEGLPRWHHRHPIHGGIVDVIYRPLSPGALLEDREVDFWAGELEEFNQEVAQGNNLVPRFTKLKECKSITKGYHAWPEAS